MLCTTGKILTVKYWTQEGYFAGLVWLINYLQEYKIFLDKYVSNLLLHNIDFPNPDHHGNTHRC